MGVEDNLGMWHGTPDNELKPIETTSCSQPGAQPAKTAGDILIQLVNSNANSKPGTCKETLLLEIVLANPTGTGNLAPKINQDHLSSDAIASAFGEVLRYKRDHRIKGPPDWRDHLGLPPKPANRKISVK